jgi:hypothetical protein
MPALDMMARSAPVKKAPPKKIVKKAAPKKVAPKKKVGNVGTWGRRGHFRGVPQGSHGEECSLSEQKGKT